MAFNPKSHITSIKGKDYLEVKWRIAWMRDDNPNWGVDTQPMQVGDMFVCKAIIFDESERQVASGIATVRAAETERTSWSGREWEKAETAALGRALAVAGYGTQFTDDFDEGEYLSDSPVQRPQDDYNNSKIKRVAKPSGEEASAGATRNVTITKRETKKAKNGKPMVVLTTTSNDVLFLFTRQPFMDKGYCSDDDWTTVGDHGDMNVTVTVEKNDKGYWGILPDSIPEFDHEFDQLGAMNPNDPEDIPL